MSDKELTNYRSIGLLKSGFAILTSFLIPHATTAFTAGMIPDTLPNPVPSLNNSESPTFFNAFSQPAYNTLETPSTSPSRMINCVISYLDCCKPVNKTVYPGSNPNIYVDPGTLIIVKCTGTKFPCSIIYKPGPTPTETLTSTLPANTETKVTTETITLPTNTETITEPFTLPPSTETLTLPSSTETLTLPTSTETFTLPTATTTVKESPVTPGPTTPSPTPNPTPIPSPTPTPPPAPTPHPTPNPTPNPTPLPTEIDCKQYMYFCKMVLEIYSIGRINIIPTTKERCKNTDSPSSTNSHLITDSSVSLAGSIPIPKTHLRHSRVNTGEWAMAAPLFTLKNKIFNLLHIT